MYPIAMWSTTSPLLSRWLRLANSRTQASASSRATKRSADWLSVFSTSTSQPSPELRRLLKAELSPVLPASRRQLEGEVVPGRKPPSHCGGGPPHCEGGRGHGCGLVSHFLDRRSQHLRRYWFYNVFKIYFKSEPLIHFNSMCQFYISRTGDLHFFSLKRKDMERIRTPENILIFWGKIFHLVKQEIHIWSMNQVDLNEMPFQGRGINSQPASAPIILIYYMN